MKPTPISRLPFEYALNVQQAQVREDRLNLIMNSTSGRPMQLELSAFEDNVLRLRLSRAGYAPQADDSIQQSQRIQSSGAQVIETESGWEIKTAGFRAVVGKQPYSFRLYAPDGKLILQEHLEDKNAVGDGEDRVPPLGFSHDQAGNALSANLNLYLNVYDTILGLGERFTEYNKRGQLVTMRNSDALGVRTEEAYKNIPFFLNTAGYGLFVNSTAQAEFHIGTRSSESLNIHLPGDQMEYYIFTGSCKEIVSAYTRLTGPAILPPDWSFETWYSNSFKASSRAAIEEDARLLREKNMPAGVIHLDCYWLRDDHWCDFIWDEQAYPSYMEMIDNIKAMGYRMCIWINPYITIVTDMFREGSEKGYFVKDKAGDIYTADLWHGLLSPCAMIDFTNPEAEKWYGAKVRNLLRQGIDAIKTDFGEDIPEDAIFANGLDGRRMRNLYARLYNESVANICRQEKGDDYLLWARSGCAGMQRYPVCWSGDPHASYSGMASVIKSGLSIGISGVPFWSHDIGGFFGLEDPELFVRWAQFGLLSSHSRFHGTTTRQPWAYGERAEKIVGDFMRLRSKLMPYILQTAKDCAENGLPFMRPMLLSFPDDRNTHHLWDQYMIGDDLIVAPVFGPDHTVRRVYLPAGWWHNYFTGETQQGSQYIEISCPLEQLPLYIRKRSSLDALLE